MSKYKLNNPNHSPPFKSIQISLLFHKNKNKKPQISLNSPKTPHKKALK